jgi:hypothetical protein
MSRHTHIRYLRRQEIDTARWDRCIREAPGGLLYLRSFFMDALGAWDAMVASPAGSDDYSFVMPLPGKTKYGIGYVYVPPFTGQLGIVGDGPVTATLVNDFFRHIPPSFRLVDMLLNETTPTPTLPGIELIPRTNYVLPLTESYPLLHAHYTADAKKNLRKCQGFLAHTDIPVETVISLYQGAYGNKSSFLKQKDYACIAQVSNLCIANGHGFTLGIHDGQGALQAAAFFGRDEKRIYYLLGAPTPAGRTNSAAHCLIDHVVRSYAASGLEFDFEGSDIPSVAAFYRKFGPLARPYYQVKFNRFPAWMQRFL